MKTWAPDILLVEDSPTTAELFVLALQSNKSSATIQVVRDGVQALDLLLGNAIPLEGARALPRLVLLDLFMPMISGFDVLKRLRAHERTRLLPVVVYSSSDLESDQREAYRLGANGYIHKPMGFRDCCETIARLEHDWLRRDSAPSIGRDGFTTARRQAGATTSNHAPDILLVEDNPFEVDVFMRAHELNKSTAKVSVARDGVQALEFLLGGDSGSGDTQNALPRLVLLDLNMPRLNGFEVLERLRADERTRLLPVVIFSASDERSDELRAQRLGASGYVRKPAGFITLRSTLAELERHWLMWKNAPPQTRRSLA